MTSPDVVERLRSALKRIATLRPAGDVATATGTRALVQQMETIALQALASIPLVETQAGNAAIVDKLESAGQALLDVADRFATEAAEPFGSEARELMREALATLRTSRGGAEL